MAGREDRRRQTDRKTLMAVACTDPARLRLRNLTMGQELVKLASAPEILRLVIPSPRLFPLGGGPAPRLNWQTLILRSRRRRRLEGGSAHHASRRAPRDALLSMRRVVVTSPRAAPQLANPHPEEPPKAASRRRFRSPCFETRSFGALLSMRRVVVTSPLTPAQPRVRSASPPLESSPRAGSLPQGERGKSAKAGIQKRHALRL